MSEEGQSNLLLLSGNICLKNKEKHMKPQEKMKITYQVDPSVDTGHYSFSNLELYP